MKLSTLTLAMAAIVAANGAFAGAGDPQINISGSSATNNQLKYWVQQKLCSANTTYTVGSNDFLVDCTVAAAFTAAPYNLPAHINIAKNSAGGSGNGITPLPATGPTLSFITFPCAAGTCTGTTGAIHPDMGMSDEEPAVLAKANAAPVVAGLTSDTLNVVTFGTPVTLGLRNALQTAQIASGQLPATCVAGNDSEACMPSLTKNQIASIFGGQLVGWSELGLTNPAGDDNVYIARRVQTSGTQTDARIYFLNDPCATNMTQFLAGDIAAGIVAANFSVSNDGTKLESITAANACNNTSAAYAGKRVYEGSGSGNVETCISNHERNGRWAISINSTEFPGSTGDQFVSYTIGGGAVNNDASGNPIKLDNKNYMRHIKVDGWAPTTFNVAKGHYNNWVEATLNYVTLAGNPLKFHDAMKASFNDPVVLSLLNNSFATTAQIQAADAQLEVGIMEPARNSAAGPTYPVTKAGTQANPVNPFTHNVGGTADSCQPAMTYWASGTSM